MAEQQQWYSGKSDYEYFGLSLAADTAAYIGHLGNAQELTKRSGDSAIAADNKENAAMYQENAGLRQAGFGNADVGRKTAMQGLRLAPDSQAVQVEAALAFGMAGDTARAESLAADLNKRFPLDTQIQSLWLPAIRAQIALNHKKPVDAVKNLEAAQAIEFGAIPFLMNPSCLYPTYIRGKAYLAAGQGNAATVEFQKILDHGGIVWNCWTGALARLGVARASVLQSRISQRRGCRCCPRSCACRLQRLPHPLERRRPRHSDPERSQSRVRQTAIAARAIMCSLRQQ
jgi:eukaryotic-like serine/threonine-protein kinase